MRTPIFLLVLVGALGCGPRAALIAPLKAEGAGARTIPQLIRDLTRDRPDGSGPNSPALDELFEIGEPAIEPLLEVMLSDDEERRHFATTGLYVIFARQCGLPNRGGWRDVELQENCRCAWGCLGNLDADAPVEERQRAVELWRQWLASKPFAR